MSTQNICLKLLVKNINSCTLKGLVNLNLWSKFNILFQLKKTLYKLRITKFLFWFLIFVFRFSFCDVQTDTFYQMIYIILSYAVIVFQWITSCVNYIMTTRYITLSAGASNIMAMSVTKMQIFVEIKQFWKAQKSHLKGHMINRILQA